MDKPINITDHFLRSDVRDIEYEDIDAFCKLGIQESSWLDYKKKFGKHDRENYNVTKIVSSMANAHGGWILVGVEEAPVPVGLPGLPGALVGVPLSEAPSDRIAKICLNAIDPPVVPQIRSCRLPDSDNAIIVIRVNESDATPHRTSDGKVWIRTNDVAHLLDDGKEAIEEIEVLLRRREKAVLLRNQIIDRASSRCLMNPAVPQLIIYVLPLYPSAPILEYEQIANWQFGENQAFRGHGASLYTVQHAVMDRFDRVSDHSPTRIAVFEVSRYGSLYYRTYVTSDNYNDFELNERLVSGLLCSVVHAANRILKAAGFDGLVEIGLGLHNPGGRMKCGAEKFGTSKADRLPDEGFMVKETQYRHNMVSQTAVERLYREFVWSAGGGTSSITGEREAKIVQSSLDGLSKLDE